MTARSIPPENPVIVACTDGPLLVRGEVDLVTPDGEPIARTRKTVALCRCGVSTIKPFCDGTHKLVGFRTDPPAPDSDDD
jgi:CDGSH-type Zn-finger protein